MAKMIDVIRRNDDGSRLTGGGSLREIATEWTRTGLSPATAESYIEAGCFDAKRVATLVKAGVTPENLVRATRSLGTDAGYGHSNGDISVAEIRDAVSDDLAS